MGKEALASYPYGEKGKKLSAVLLDIVLLN